ncbi:MAG: NUMOD4 domain-containing protein [Crocinitomicaceae bacterium]|nr:NUMOD4 domain-containing protein [Crocinitomicaceae bacterium]
MTNWKKIQGYSYYEVSNLGEIKSLSREKKFKNGRIVQFESKIKKLRKHPKNGFLMTDLIDDNGKRKTIYPHKIVAQVFIHNDNPKKNKVVIHKDGKLENNNVSNLYWASYSQSILLGFKTGKRDNSNLWEKRRKKYGPKGGNLSTGRPDPLTYAQRKRVFYLRIQKGYTLKQLAEKYKCSISHIYKTIKNFSIE